MYIPPAFLESNLNTLHAFIERFSFGLLVSQVDQHPFATHLPFLLERDAGPKGTLIGHTAKANLQCHRAGDQMVMAVFSGPHVYVSPTWYQSDNVVPTWNYVAVHAYGRLKLIEDPAALTDIVKRTVAFYERTMPQPWQFDDTSNFAQRMLTQIVGFRIEIETLEGKWKLNQNQPVDRREKVIKALQQRADENSTEVAMLMIAKLLQGDSDSA
jgi:transcriptional regulator